MIDQGKNHQRYLDGKDKKDGDHIEYWERERERERERDNRGNYRKTNEGIQQWHAIRHARKPERIWCTKLTSLH